MEIHWGTYLNKSDVVIVDDGNGNMSAVSRAASPFFIRDDSGTWYLFFEAGHRLGANTAYARGEPSPSTDDIHPQDNEAERTVVLYKQDDGYILRNTLSEAGIYKVFNLTGNLIKEGLLSRGETTIDIDRGIYIIQITAGKNNFTLKTY